MHTQSAGRQNISIILIILTFPLLIYSFYDKTSLLESSSPCLKPFSKSCAWKVATHIRMTVIFYDQKLYRHGIFFSVAANFFHQFLIKYSLNNNLLKNSVCRIFLSRTSLSMCVFHVFSASNLRDLKCSSALRGIYFYPSIK